MLKLLFWVGVIYLGYRVYTRVKFLKQSNSNIREIDEEFADYEILEEEEKEK